MSSIAFDNTYVRELSGFYAPWQPEQSDKPRLVYFNAPLAQELGIEITNDADKLAQLFTGNQLPEGAEPIAQAYAGHQFGHFSPQLGDGRALIIGEVVTGQGQRYDIALKGSGRTPFSRGGDGKAAIGPVLREALIGEAMHALGVPSTRALAVATTGEPVYREQTLPGAVLTRVASSHIRIGTFEFFAARGQKDHIQRLADYAIERHDRQLLTAENPYLAFLQAVTDRQANLVAHWMSLGFIHGVMNTDNMSIAGETIDYGPCAFMEAYDPKTVFSSIDQQGRYAYQNQPGIAQWNLAKLAEALLPLIDKDSKQAVARATEVINTFPDRYQHAWLTRMRAKLGLTARESERQQDSELINEWLQLLKQNQVDFTLAWRRLADAAEGQPESLRSLFSSQLALDTWLAKWQARCVGEDTAQARAQIMRQTSPWLIPRNHWVEQALAAASDNDDLEPFTKLMAAMQNPYTENPDMAHYAEPAPTIFTDRYQTFCGT